MARVLGIMFFIIFLCSGSYGYSEEGFAYIAKITNMYLSPEVSQPIGKIYIGAKVAIVKKEGGWIKVNIVGWRQYGLSCVIYAFMGKRIFMVKLNHNGEKIVKILKSVEDKDTQLKWEKVELKGVWVKSDVVVKNKDLLWEKASKLFHQRCSMCHALPKTTTFTANQWPATLRVMTKRAALTKQQASIVSLFLQYHARDIGKR